MTMRSCLCLPSHIWRESATMVGVWLTTRIAACSCPCWPSSMWKTSSQTRTTSQSMLSNKGSVKGTNTSGACVWRLCVYNYICVWVGFTEKGSQRRRVLKCGFVYDRVWSSWGDPVWLTERSNPVTNQLPQYWILPSDRFSTSMLNSAFWQALYLNAKFCLLTGSLPQYWILPSGRLSTSILNSAFWQALYLNAKFCLLTGSLP